jgi:carboxyl-terminal processing protease
MSVCWRRRAFLWATSLLAQAATPPQPVLAQIDKAVREEFFDPTLKGVDWDAAVAKAAQELARTETPEERDAVYDRLLAVLEDSHTFRLVAGKLPDRNWGTAGLRIGQDGDGYAVKGIVPEGPADAAGMKVGDRILAVDRVVYGKSRVSFDSSSSWRGLRVVQSR